MNLENYTSKQMVAVISKESHLFSFCCEATKDGIAAFSFCCEATKEGIAACQELAKQGNAFYGKEVLTTAYFTAHIKTPKITW